MGSVQLVFHLRPSIERSRVINGITAWLNRLKPLEGDRRNLTVDITTCACFARKRYWSTQFLHNGSKISGIDSRVLSKVLFASTTCYMCVICNWFQWNTSLIASSQETEHRGGWVGVGWNGKGHKSKWWWWHTHPLITILKEEQETSQNQFHFCLSLFFKKKTIYSRRQKPMIPTLMSQSVPALN